MLAQVALPPVDEPVIRGAWDRLSHEGLDLSLIKAANGWPKRGWWHRRPHHDSVANARADGLEIDRSCASTSPDLDGDVTNEQGRAQYVWRSVGYLCRRHEGLEAQGLVTRMSERSKSNSEGVGRLVSLLNESSGIRCCDEHAITHELQHHGRLNCPGGYQELGG
jgi:hypothetical protein